MDKYLDADTLYEARDVIAAHGGILPCAKEAYDGEEYPPSYVVALRCIDRMIPRRVHEEYDTRLFRSRRRKYQCPVCKHALNDYAPKDGLISDAILYCPFCGQALEWEG